MNCLYIFEISVVWTTMLATIFSHSVNCLFIMFMISFAVQKVISLIRSHLYTFDSFSIALGDWPKKRAVWFLSEDDFPTFFSRSPWCVVSCLRPQAILSSFWLNVVHVGSNCSDLNVALWLSQHNLMRRLSLSPYIGLAKRFLQVFP